MNTLLVAAEPFIPYDVEVIAYTHAGGGAIARQTVFTQEGGKFPFATLYSTTDIYTPL